MAAIPPGGVVACIMDLFTIYNEECSKTQQLKYTLYIQEIS